jgi:glycosyltransferase involved in cell wall biosynthesis
VINQIYDNVEYIIIDGGSTDSTLEIIKKYEKFIDYWTSEKDRGIYDAMNKGIKLAHGQIIGIINSDDWYELDALWLAYEEYSKTNADVIYGEMNVYKDNIFYFKSGIAINLNGLKKGMIINHPTVFVKKDVYDNYDAFSIKYKIASDWELMVRYWKADLKFSAINKPIANLRLGGESYKFNKYTIKEKHSIRKMHDLYRFIDVYYIIDNLRLIIPSSLVLKVSVFKQKVFYIIRNRFG